MNDKKNIKEVIQTFFDGYSELNLKKIAGACTSDFILVENGETSTIEEFIQLVKEIDKVGFNRINRLTFGHLNINSDFSIVVYYNEADISYPNSTFYYKWHESALVLKEGESWKIKLLHSTVLKNEKTKLN